MVNTNVHSFMPIGYKINQTYHLALRARNTRSHDPLEDELTRIQHVLQGNVYTEMLFCKKSEANWIYGVNILCHKKLTYSSSFIRTGLVQRATNERAVNPTVQPKNLSVFCYSLIIFVEVQKNLFVPTHPWFLFHQVDLYFILHRSTSPGVCLNV